MAAAATLPALLSTLTESLKSASSSLPDASTLTPPVEGISLLDTKNELLLSYLQNLVFLIILKLRNFPQSGSPNLENDKASEASLNDTVTRKLIELRIYLEKGVRPLESRLKYQVDKLLLAASEASTTHATNSADPKPKGGQINTDASDTDLEAKSAPPPNMPDLAHRPNPSAFIRPSQSSNQKQDTSGLYRPPRITPTALPTTERAQKKDLKPRKSATLDAYIREEMDDAPVAEPSIGAGSGLRGREKEREEERMGYEETRLVRLPGTKKKRRVDPGEDLTGGFGSLGDVDFGTSKGGKRKKSAGREEERVGERWEKRVKKGVGRKRR
ncbi:hypothetical protein MMC28_003647 [Mycoblastus sanguinarius]|nr:hypothetical protein [Mycoblastus sanguinarius]